MSPECVSLWLQWSAQSQCEELFKWLEWGRVCSCACVFLAKRKHGIEEHAFCTHDSGLNPGYPVPLPSGRVALGKSLILSGSQSSPAQWGQEPSLSHRLLWGLNGWMFVKPVLMFVSSTLSCEHLRFNTLHTNSFIVFLSSVNDISSFPVAQAKNPWSCLWPWSLFLYKQLSQVYLQKWTQNSTSFHRCQPGSRHHHLLSG